MKNKKIVAFDVDGTLLDSAAGITYCMKYALEKNNVKLDPNFNFNSLVGPPFAISLEKMGLNSENQKKIRFDYLQAYQNGEVDRKFGVFNAVPYEGIKEALDSIKNKGYTIITATSKPEESAILMLEHFNLIDHFDNVFGAVYDEERFTKAEILQHGLNKIGLDESGSHDSNVVLIGDRLYDTVGAREVGTSCIGVSWGYADEGELEAENPAAIIHNPSELLETIEKVIGKVN
jgi:phosphoglycolate phosphatase